LHNQGANMKHTVVLRSKDEEAKETHKTYEVDGSFSVNDFLAGPDGIVWNDFDKDEWYVEDIFEERVAPVAPDLGLMIPIIRNMVRKYERQGLANDCFQEGVLAILKKGCPSTVTSPQAWFITVARNAIIDYLRKQGSWASEYNGLANEEYDNNDREVAQLESGTFKYPTLGSEELSNLLIQKFNETEVSIIRLRLRNQTDAQIGITLNIPQQRINEMRRSLAKRLQALLA